MSTSPDLDKLGAEGAAGAQDARTLAVLAIAPGARVLDLAPADGEAARLLRERGCSVAALTPEDRTAELEQLCDRVVAGDLDELDPAAAFGTGFDAVLLLDALGRVRDPEELLRRLLPLLAPQGKLLASVLNVAHASVRLQLLLGRFPFRHGEPDAPAEGQVRFFDAPAVADLLRQAGYAAEDVLRVERGLGDAAGSLDLEELPAEALALATADPDALTYEFLVLAVPAGPDGQPTRAAGGLLERLQAENASLRARLAEAQETLRRQHGEAEELLAEQGALRRDLAARDEYLADLRGRVVEHEQALAAAQAAAAEAQAGAAALGSQLAALQADTESGRAEQEALRSQLAAREAELAALQAELGPLREHLAAVHGDPVVRAAAVLRRVPLLPRLVRALRRR